MRLAAGVSFACPIAWVVNTSLATMCAEKLGCAAKQGRSCIVRWIYQGWRQPRCSWFIGGASWRKPHRDGTARRTNRLLRVISEIRHSLRCPAQLNKKLFPFATQ